MTGTPNITRDATELLTVREASERYHVHVNTLRIWIRKGVVPHVRVGPFGAIRLRAIDLSRTVTPADQDPR